MTSTAPATLVVPCYDEAHRLDAGAFVALLDADPACSLLFVNDGSTDGTAALLAALAARRPGRIRVLDLGRNRGKAEAVRRGLLDALAAPAEIVGYVDADLATPTAEVERLLELMRGRDTHVLLAARVALLGRRIERGPLRHYLGRIFASMASLVLRLRVYDTQCGAKLFRAGPALSDALSAPFLSV